MTKLMEWVVWLGVFTGIWALFVMQQVPWSAAEEWRHIILPLPLILLILFGVYAATVVLWRVYNFNNCEEAAKEMQQQIEQAKTDLRKKGFKFEAKT